MALPRELKIWRPNNRMNLTGIPLRSIPAGYPRR
jgi:hypothetical protein